MSFGKVFSVVLLSVFLIGLSTSLKERKYPREIKVMVKKTKDILREFTREDELGNNKQQRNLEYPISINAAVKG